MKIFKCDNDDCDNTQSSPKVTLKGITGTSGGILLPEVFHVKHFCDPKCFWAWAKKYKEENLLSKSERLKLVESRMGCSTESYLFDVGTLF